MKLRKTVYLCFLVAMWASFSAAICFATSLDVTDIRTAGNMLYLNAVVSGKDNLKAGGFSMTFPADRLIFVKTETSDRVIAQSSVQGAMITTGYMVTAGNIKRLEINFSFRITGNAPYMIAANSSTFRDDLYGADGGRPGIYGSAEDPVIWSNPGQVANLFLYIPHLSRITDVSLRAGGQDVLGSLIAVSSWYVDPVMDVAYLVLPGIGMPAGSYPVSLAVTYGESTEFSATNVVVK